MLIVGATVHVDALKAIVGGEPREVASVDEMGEAMARIASGGVDVVLLDLSIAPGDIGLTVLDAARLDAPATDVVAIVDPDNPEWVGTAYERGAAWAMIRPSTDDGNIPRIIEWMLRAKRGESLDRPLKAVDAVVGADIGRRVRARTLEWAVGLTDARGSAIFRLDDRGQGKSFVYAREHPAMVERVAPLVLEKMRPIELLGTEEERRRYELPDQARHGPALLWPLATRIHSPGVLIVVREGGTAPFTRAEADKLSMVANLATLAYDRVAAQDLLSARAEELDVLQERLAQAEKKQGVGQMATQYAHQITAPLQYLQAQLREALAAVQQLDDDQDEVREAKMSVMQARDGADRVQAVVGELSLLGRSRDDAQVPIDRLIGISRRITEPKQGVEVVSELEEISVIGNITDLAHAIHQVLDNAVRVSEDKVVIRASQAEHWCTLVILDDGGGMPKSVYQRIFEPMFTTRKDAAGMGLPDAKSVIEAHGGHLQILNEFGVGTTAVIHLPLHGRSSELPLPERFRTDGTAASLPPESLK